ncbi:catalase family protein [Psychrobacter frigidicola]|uniref:Catalase family protein n=1 Tax=Psychrobacter frigidicola TaxID=45611 RepID=A0A5C7A331_9GAMM|nr:catalase family protein [Psychrobacter frigidicola]TXD97652.1 catalase family protein [Psychrobacter frigidicola]
MLKKLFKPKYVPYDTKYIELSEQDERNIRTITDDIRNYITRSDKASNVNYHTRDAHAKGYCALKAKFEILDNIPKEYAQGLYAKSGIHDAVIRFSNGASRVSPDRKLGLAQGLAIKVFDVLGEKLAPGEEDSTTFDFNLINHPVFFCNRIEDYAYISKLFLELPEYSEKGAIGKAQLAFNWLTNYGSRLPTKESLKTFKTLGGFTSIEPKNTLLYDFHSQGVVRHGEYMAKIRVKPTEASNEKVKRRDLDLATKEEAIRPLIINEIREHDYEFEVQIQLCRNPKKQPIEELTTEWKESDAPFVTVARLTIPCQDVPDDGNFDIMENLSFTPFRCLEENRPIGNLQQSRLKAYQIASETRHELNDVKRQEPKRLKEVFDKSFF